MSTLIAAAWGTVAGATNLLRIEAPNGRAQGSAPTSNEVDSLEVGRS